MGQSASAHGYSPGGSSSSSSHNRYITANQSDAVSFTDGNTQLPHGIFADKKDYTSEIPDECLALIFQSLSSGDRKRCSVVCRRWLLVDGQSRNRLSLNATADIYQQIPAIFSRFDSVTKLALRCDRKSSSINDDALALISLRCRNLTGDVNLVGSWIGPAKYFPPFITLSQPPPSSVKLLLSLSFSYCIKSPPKKPTKPISSSSRRARILQKMEVATVKMMSIINLILIVSSLMMPISFADESSMPAKVVKVAKGKKYCTKGWECAVPSVYCCNLTISDYFQTYQFENLFSKRNSPEAHAVGFWDYKSFITGAALYQPLGFGTTGNKTSQMKEVSAFLGHVGAKTSCGYGVATGGPLAWGLCYNKEMSPSKTYCDDYYKLTYPCTPGVSYHGRGALPIYWNYNYGAVGEALKQDLLNHPEYIEQNATLAFQAAIHKWMTPGKKGQPSAHDAFVGNWKPTKNDTDSKRVPGFGATMNILYGDTVCGNGDVDDMNVIISHYLYYLDILGVSREEAGPHEVLSCAEQKAFNPSYSASTSS